MYACTYKYIELMSLFTNLRYVGQFTAVTQRTDMNQEALGHPCVHPRAAAAVVATAEKDVGYARAGGSAGPERSA